MMKFYHKLIGSIRVKNILIDNNIVLDYFSNSRREKYPESILCFDYLLKSDIAFISSSSLDNIAYIKMKYLKDEGKENIKENVKELIKFLTKSFKIAKTPSYIEIDYDDIEDSQIIASAKAIDALVLTRDEKMLSKYPDITISPKELLVTATEYSDRKEIVVDNHDEQKKNNLSQSLKTVTKIDFANLKKQYFMYQNELEKEMDKVLNKASYIMGDAVRELEANLCEFTGAKEAVTCGSGTDALLLAMMALDIKPGDEIITTPFTFIATAETIALLGAKPVFVDIDEKTYNIDVNKIEEKITPKTKAIIAVSLYGQPSDMDAIQAIIDKTLKTKNQKLKTIIDGAQSFGATYKGKSEVHYCDIYTTSFFPAKPLGCFGDGGAVLTNSNELAEKMKMLRVHGQNRRYHHKYIGLGARMDTIQCAVVNVKLKYYKEDLAKRQEVAKKYNQLLVTEDSDRFAMVNSNSNEQKNFVTVTDNCHLILPTVKSDRTSAFAQYSIRVQNRDELQTKLKEQGIPTAIHYPMPLHLQECFTYLGYKEGDFPIAERVSNEIMSLPMNPYLTDDEIEYIIEKVTQFA